MQNRGEYKDYHECRKDAQRSANESGREYGLEKNSLFGYYRFFSLPGKKFRSGFELRCEVVSPDILNPVTAEQD